MEKRTFDVLKRVIYRGPNIGNKLKLFEFGLTKLCHD